MDKLVINDIKLSTRIGIHPWEQRCSQALQLDLILQTDARKIAQSDSIEDALDYDKILARVFSLATSHTCQLIESFAEKIAQELLSHFNTTWVQVSLRKPGAVLQAKDVGIIIERSKV